MTQRKFAESITRSIFGALTTAAPMIPGATPATLEWYRRVLKVSELGITAALDEYLKRVDADVEGLDAPVKGPPYG